GAAGRPAPPPMLPAPPRAAPAPPGRRKGLYEPIHGSAPDIAGQGKANPLAMILSMAMMFRYTFRMADIAGRIEKAVRAALATGIRTGDIASKRDKPVTTTEMGSAVVKAL